MQYHMKVVHNKPYKDKTDKSLPEYFCEHCGLKMATQTRYITHIRSKHTGKKKLDYRDSIIELI